MNRREFLGAVAAAPIAVRGVAARGTASRTFEITTKISLEESHDAGVAWVPLPLARATYQIDRGHTVGGNADKTRVERLAASGAAILVAQWGHMMPPPELVVTMKVDATDHRVSLASPNGATRTANLANYLKPTPLIPVDGIVKETADAITKGRASDLAKARAIYDWIVENTVRDADVKGCGLGDIRGMLEMKNLSGKCADLNALFVGLARASGLPARDLYGLRVAPSSQFPSLGRTGGNVTTAQHCRAEVWADGYGWIPVDPADVRKLMLEEKRPSLGDPYVAKAREALFGAWETNWIAFNDAHNVALPGSAGRPLPFLMYPQAEVGGTRLDSLDPDTFKYTDHRARTVISGVNYPWSIYQGRPNYGCDFGRNKWNSHSGVTAHLDEVRADFEGMAEAGYEVARWFVFTDGRGGLDWHTSGEVAGVADRLTDDMDAAVGIAGATGVRLCLVLVDFTWLDDPARRAAVESTAFIDRVLDPFLDRYGAHDAIHSYDVINEPDWRPEWPIENLRTFVGAAADRIHSKSRALVTLGGGRVRNAKEWDDPAYGLDFVQVHSYPDVRYPDRDDSLFGRTAASFGLTKPLLVGECPSDPRRHPSGHLSPAYTLEDYLVLARDGGYLGAWPWSFKGVDAFGSPSGKAPVR